MNVLTSSWNDTDYATATKFQCRKSGAILTIAANNPDKVRSMHDSCLAGSYAADPSIINGGADVNGGAGPTATISGTASWNAAAAPVWGAVLAVVSSDVGVGTVPATVTVGQTGTFSITVTRVAAGTTTVTITGPGTTANDTVDVTFS